MNRSTAWVALALLPNLAWAQGPGDMMLGDPEEFELRTFEGTVRQDFDSGRLVVKEGRARFALPDHARALRGRTVRVQGVVGGRLGAGVRDLEQVTWLTPSPHSVTGALRAVAGSAVLVRGDDTYRLTPPPGLPESALRYLAGRTDVAVHGFLYAGEGAQELVVSGIEGRIGELTAGDEAYLSQRTRTPHEPNEDGVRYDFQSALDAEGQRQRLANGTPVKVTDLEIYRVADRAAGETVGRFREIPAGWAPSDLAEDERLFVYVERMDRHRNPGDARSEGWLPLRKVAIGETLADKLLDGIADVAKTMFQPEGSAPAAGLADVVGQIDEAQALAGAPAEVSADALSLRRDPEGIKLAVLPGGTELELTGERDGEWLGVRTREPLDGWVDSRYLSGRDAEVTVANASRLNVRAAPSLEGDVVVVLAEGFELQVVERKGKWARVQAQLEGFAHEAFLTH